MDNEDDGEEADEIPGQTEYILGSEPLFLRTEDDTSFWPPFGLGVTVGLLLGIGAMALLYLVLR